MTEVERPVTANVPKPLSELRTASEVASWLATGLAVRRVPGDEDYAQAMIACANQLPALPPPGVIADVAALLAGAPMAGLPPISANDLLRSALRSYEDDVLARLVQTARFDDVLAAFAHLPTVDRPAAVALVVGGLCERAGFTGTSVSPAALRRALARPRQEREAGGRIEVHGDAMAVRLAEAYVTLSRGARQSRALVDDREVFAIDHLTVLRDLGGRMTASHIAAAAEALARTFPRRLPANRQKRGARDTRLADDSLYPAGGFSAITPGGANANLENLVASELAYMEDGPGPDVFTLRYVEGELLHYTRDDSVFRRHRHVIGIVLMPDLDGARVKDRELPWQRLVLALGLVVAAVRWLTEQLGDEALVIQLSFPPNLMSEERSIVTLLLEGELASGTVTITEQSPQQAAEKAHAAATAAISDLLVVSIAETPRLPKGLRALHINLSAPAPAVAELSPDLKIAPDLGPDPWADWRDGAEELLRWLV